MDARHPSFDVLVDQGDQRFLLVRTCYQTTNGGAASGAVCVAFQKNVPLGLAEERGYVPFGHRGSGVQGEFSERAF